MNRREALAALVALPEVARISVARVKPTDVIVVESDDLISLEHAERIKTHLRKVWPDTNQKILVLDKSLRIKVVEGA